MTAASGQDTYLNFDNGKRRRVSSYKEVAAGTHTMAYALTGSDSPEWVAHSVIAIVPEPATMCLLAAGAAGMLLRRRK